MFTSYAILLRAGITFFGRVRATRRIFQFKTCTVCSPCLKETAGVQKQFFAIKGP
jgi:hypothetical protein